MTRLLLCTACDEVGHLATDCPHYRGASRHPANPEMVVQPFMGGEYTVRLLGRTSGDERVIEITDPDDTKHAFVVKRATGEGCNCLIDTLRQTLHADGDIPLSGGIFGVGSELI